MLSKSQLWLPTMVIIAAMALATYWTFLVPIFQSADEDIHTDYIFSLYTKDKLIRGSEYPIAAISSPYVAYLLRITDATALKWKSFVKVSPDYGTLPYFRTIDKNAPNKFICAQTKSNPIIMAVYPVGYYALTALWLNLISHWSTSLTALFFAARLFSVFLLGWALTMSYLTMQELKLERWQSIFILATISFFPLVTFVSSSIQPDNLSFALLSTIFLLNLRWLNKPEKKYFWAIALTLSMLLLTKYQFFLCASIATAGMIASKKIRQATSAKSVYSALISLFIPAILISTIQFYVSWHCQLPKITKEVWHWFPVDTAFREAFNSGTKSFFSFICSANQFFYTSTYCIDGRTFKSFWGWFGWLDTPLIIGSVPINETIRWFIQLITILVLLLTFISLMRIAIIICRLISKKHFRAAYDIAFSNPIINTYFLFVVFMWLFTINNYENFAPQGRHWYPVILPIILAASIFAPKVFRNKIARKTIFIAIVGAWFLYSILGSYYAIDCLKARYYIKKTQPYIDLQSLKPSTNSAQYSIEKFDYIDPQQTLNYHPAPLRNVPSNSKHIYIKGWAIDSISEKPVTAVLLFIDDRPPIQAAYGLESLEAIDKFNNNTYRYTGYGALISTSDLNPGPHTLTIKFVSSDNRVIYPTNRIITFNILK